MSYYTPTTFQIAAKEHCCTWCGEPIKKAYPYYRWASVEDKWFTNKMHPECRDVLLECPGEYVAFINERPEP